MGRILVFSGVLSLAFTAPSLAAEQDAGAPVSKRVQSLTPEQQQDLANKLGHCFVMKSTGEDRITFSRWFVSALASAPQIADVATVDPAKKDELDRKVAGIFTRLMTVDCKEEAKPLFKARSSAGFSIAGEALGRMAMQELLGNTQTAEAMMGGYASYLHQEDFAELAK